MGRLGWEVGILEIDTWAGWMDRWMWLINRLFSLRHECICVVVWKEDFALSACEIEIYGCGCGCGCSE